MALLLCAAVVSDRVSAQQPATSEGSERGIQLYKQGDAQGASEVLRATVKRHKDDISAWHYLGLALRDLGKRDDARKAHERAAKLADNLVSTSLDGSIIPPKTLLLEGAESADEYLALSANPSKKKVQEWHDRAEFLRTFVTEASSVAPIYSGRDVTTKARVISKPEPTYTDEARAHQVTGTVILRAIFAADSRVRAIHVVSGLPDGLTRSAILSARRIKFIPATKDGKPVSMWMELQYNFNLY